MLPTTRQTRPSTMTAPSSTTRAMADLTGLFHGRLQEIPGNFRRKAISASLAPTVAERGVLEARRDELQAALCQGGKAHQPAAAQLVFVFPAFGADEISDAATIERLVGTLAPYPVWAVSEAVQRFRHNRAVTAWDRGRCPTEPQIVAEVRAIMAPVEAELHRISSILDAEVLPEPTEADRAKVAQLAADLARSMRFPRHAISEQELARVTEGGMGGLKLDRRILSKAGVPSEAA